MKFADIHIHALYGVDDGAKFEKNMVDIVDASYSDGVRQLCFSPHYHPGFFRSNSKKMMAHFSNAKEFFAQRHPDLNLYFANELRYDRGCVSWLNDGRCKTINDTRYVLVDFTSGADRRYITDGLNDLLNSGYKPVLAHTERYLKLRGNLSDIKGFKSKGILIQLDSQSVLGNNGFFERLRSRKILDKGLADLISSDAHNIDSRPPGISDCYSFIRKKHGTRYANALCYYNAISVLNGLPLKKDWSIYK